MQETHLSARPEFDPWAGKIPAEGNDHCSFVENRMDRGAWRATVHRVARVRHDDSATTVLLINSHVLLLLMLLPTLPFRIDHAAHTNTQGVAQTLLPLSPAHSPAAAWPSSLDHASVRAAAASGLCTSVLGSRLPLPRGASPTLGSSRSIYHLHLPPRLPGPELPG